MLSENLADNKRKLMRLGKAYPIAEIQFKKLTQVLGHTTEYEKLFNGKFPNQFIELQLGVAENTLEVINHCIKLEHEHKEMKADDVTFIQQRVENSDQLLKAFNESINKGAK